MQPDGNGVSEVPPRADPRECGAGDVEVEFVGVFPEPEDGGDAVFDGGGEGVGGGETVVDVCDDGGGAG